MRALLFLVAVSVATAWVGGCSSGRPIPPHVAITFNGEPGKLPFDPQDARLRAAAEKLTGAAGHPVGLELDVALLREYRAWFQTGLITAVESAAHDLSELTRTRPEASAAILPKLTTVSWRYDRAARKVMVKLDADRRALDVAVPPRATSFLPHEAALLGLEAQYDADLPKRYADGVPASVSVAEKRAYFRSFANQKLPPAPNPAAQPGPSNEVRAATIVRATRLYRVPMPLDLKAEVHEWLLLQGDYFRDAYLIYPDIVKVLSESSPFHRAETAWIDWVRKNGENFTDGERLTLAKMVFVKLPRKDHASGRRYVSFAFPGFDLYAFGLSIIEEWSAAGHPVEVYGRDKLALLYRFIACPFETDDRGERLQVGGCEHDFYRLALESEANQKRLLDSMIARKDEILVETALLNYIRMSEPRAVTYLWRGLESNDALWKVATRVIAEEIGDAESQSLQDEALRLWQTYPARRGALLYLLGQIDRYGNDRVAWGAWGDKGGGRASAADFTAFLEHGRRAYATAWTVWPLLSRGWSRAQIVLGGLDRYIDDRLAPFYHPQDPHLAVLQMVSRMCAEGNFADLAKMHAYFVERIKARPTEEKPLATLLEETTRGRCRPKARPVVRAEALETQARAGE